MTSKQTEALKLALECVEAWDRGCDRDPYWRDIEAAVTAIKEALAEQPAQQQEPAAVARVDDLERGGRVRALAMGLGLDAPLYTTPPQRKPLTDEELRAIENKINPNMRWRSSDEEGITLYPIEYYELVRAIEAAHGIKENT